MKLLTMRRQFENAKNNIAEYFESIPSVDEISIIHEFTISQKTLVDYTTLDYDHRLDIRKLTKNIKLYSQDYTKKRPLNVIMIAHPGSGKSHFIRCLSKSLDYYDVVPVTLNMANLENMNDFLHPVEEVRNLKVSDKLPILFIDEFDSNPTNYSKLLPLLGDGEIYINNRMLKLGKVIIVLAGSSPLIEKLLKDIKDLNIDYSNINDKDKKIVDLLSRINGGTFKIPYLENDIDGINRTADKICVAISFIKKRFGDEIKYIPWSLLKLIISINFNYGIRSLSTFIDYLSKNSIDDKILVEELQFPFNNKMELINSSLIQHINLKNENIQSFLEKCQEILLNTTFTKIKQDTDEYDN